jgi:adenylate cyclase class 2
MTDEIEIEIKLKLEDDRPLLKWLQKNARLEREIHQVDQYFDPPGGSLRATDGEGCLDADEFFRVRFADDGESLCFKHWYRDEETGSSSHCDEYELKIENGERMIKILTALRFKETARIEKDRSIWRYRDFEISLDEVKKLGNFVEFEYKGRVTDPAEDKKRLFDLVKEIGLKNWRKTKRGYCFMLWNPGKEHFE